MCSVNRIDLEDIGRYSSGENQQGDTQQLPEGHGKSWLKQNKKEIPGRVGKRREIKDFLKKVKKSRQHRANGENGQVFETQLPAKEGSPFYG